MKIGELGEIGLIERLTRKSTSPRVLVGVGDDTAVLKIGDDLVLFTADLLVEGDHFRREWASGRQIGRKVMASNVSDIAAMGGSPGEALVSISLPDDVEVEFLDELYEGMYEVADEFRAEIAGGDTTHGKVLTINIALLGYTTEANLCLRSGAKAGDNICVTGHLGGSRAGLGLLLEGLSQPEESVKKHLDPGCRMDISPKIAPHASSMIDVSDGLASETRHICNRSGVGAEIYKDKIPMLPSTLEAASIVGGDAFGFALSGGEDFELLFTVHDDQLSKVSDWSTIVGKILPQEEGAHLVDGEKITLPGGYDHFNGWRPDRH